ncbi:hypothetical protein [Frigidibacter sp. ROC022]|uniref:hypothetical protein n=1 Tax=Frigidibacter sp. ROC022 TaxID=2971796 RepID=UPI00215ADD0D|nr:hypothetical protein [Frigidibacter sp. ROC022]MCR8724067.1 hypothetical protein [Frigidibacter sp. ROC022]
MRPFLSGLFGLVLLSTHMLASPLAAEGISAEIGETGITATRDRLAALPAPDDAERFALAGLRFLGGVEAALQARYDHAFSPEMNMIPVLRLTVPENPAPQPFRADLVRDIFGGLIAEMAAARAQLAAIPEDSDFGLELRPADLWFDIDGDGRRGAGEEFHEVLGMALFARTGFDSGGLEQITIRFDVADSRWLSAYAALIEGVGELVLAYDPTRAIADVMAANQGLAAVNDGQPMLNAMDMNFGRFVDSAVAVQRALAQQPDRDHAARALQRFEEVVRANHDFWRLAAAETDDAMEWIPNARQHSALGLEMPPNAGEEWLKVLDDADRLLKGELLLPYWRLGEGAGLNLRRMFEDPRPVDLFAWVQGIGALPYAETGERISSRSWRSFDRLMQGRGMLFAVLFN